MYRTDFWTLWEKARVGCLKRTALKHVYYLGWNRSPAHVGFMTQVLGPGVLGRPRGIGWRGRWEGGLGWGIHIYPWLIHVNVWQKPLQYCKVISLQLIKRKKKKKKKKKNQFRMEEWRGGERTGRESVRKTVFMCFSLRPPPPPPPSPSCPPPLCPTPLLVSLFYLCLLLLPSTSLRWDSQVGD